MINIRTRFAPSPTGYLHVGSLRTALFAYLTAKKLGGKVILRIEDTDRKRFVPGSVESLINVLDWVGIKFDEGPHIGGDLGPYTQSERKSIYDRYIKELIDKKEAYYCFCDEERLVKMREEQQANKLPPRYDRQCRDMKDDEVKRRLATGEKYVIRQKMPLSGETIVHDELRGDIRFKNEDLEDHVLIKSDGMPTYHFALIIDDHLMEISHVIRGEEWIPSFPKNILLYKSFDWPAPLFYHMPLTLNKTGGKLSKRQGDVAVEDYQKKGYLPEALINFSALLGWHPKNENEIFSLAELEKEFNIEEMGTSPAVFDIEKLDYLNGYYIRKKNIEDLTDLCIPYLIEAGFLEKESDSTSNSEIKNLQYKNLKNNEIVSFDFISKTVFLEQERLKRLADIAETTDFFFTDKPAYEPELLIWKNLPKSEIKINLEKILILLDEINEKNWQKNFLENNIIDYLKTNEFKVGDYLWPMRVALTGKKASPGPFEVAEVLGKEKSLLRIRDAINSL